jgi:hypothetical protein
LNHAFGVTEPKDAAYAVTGLKPNHDPWIKMSLEMPLRFIRIILFFDFVFLMSICTGQTNFKFRYKQKCFNLACHVRRPSTIAKSSADCPHTVRYSADTVAI